MKYFSIFILILCVLPQFSCNCQTVGSNRWEYWCNFRSYRNVATVGLTLYKCRLFSEYLSGVTFGHDFGKVLRTKDWGGFEFLLEWINEKSLLGNKLNLRYKGKLISEGIDDRETYSITTV